MRTGHQTYSPKKTEMLQKIKEYSEGSQVIAASRIRKVRARQMMALRKDFRGELNILVAKNKLVTMALKDSRTNIDQFLTSITDQNALIFTSMNPFKLQLMLDKNKVDLPARAGDIATNDVILPAGNTGMPPGPVLSEFKELKVPTKIDAGNIVVTQDTTVVKTGEKISPKLSGLLAKLNLKPIKAGLSLNAAYMDGLVFHRTDLSLNLDEYQRNIQAAFNSAMALAVNSAFLTKETTPLILAQAARHARALAVEAAIPTRESLPDILSTAQLRAQTILSLAQKKGFSG
ncbi:MAG: 50S ribosomal protein L10 [Thaumarchaeota archaeon]|nr:50S ribosomal protein L10 [Nitrososphaerota archaeon]